MPWPNSYLARAKAGIILVVSRELAQNMSGAASALLSKEMRQGIIAATDQLFLRLITAGLTPLGGSPSDPLPDIGNALDQMTIGSASKPYLILTPDQAQRLATRATSTGAPAFPTMGIGGGTLAGIPVLVSDWVTITTGASAVLLDASMIAADAEPPTLAESRHASLQMDNAPGQSVGAGSPQTPNPTSLVSLFQTNSRALLLERWLGASRLSANAVQLLSSGW